MCCAEAVPVGCRLQVTGGHADVSAEPGQGRQQAPSRRGEGLAPIAACSCLGFVVLPAARLRLQSAD